MFTKQHNDLKGVGQFAASLYLHVTCPKATCIGTQAPRNSSRTDVSYVNCIKVAAVAQQAPSALVFRANMRRHRICSQRMPTGSIDPLYIGGHQIHGWPSWTSKVGQHETRPHKTTSVLQFPPPPLQRQQHHNLTDPHVHLAMQLSLKPRCNQHHML